MCTKKIEASVGKNKKVRVEQFLQQNFHKFQGLDLKASYKSILIFKITVLRYSRTVGL